MLVTLHGLEVGDKLATPHCLQALLASLGKGVLSFQGCPHRTWKSGACLRTAESGVSFKPLLCSPDVTLNAPQEVTPPHAPQTDLLLQLGVEVVDAQHVPHHLGKAGGVRVHLAGL